jgi:hypothetical protein
VKGGGTLVTAFDALYSTKGNNTTEFYQYVPATADRLPVPADRPGNLQADDRLPASGLGLTVSPNPVSDRTTIRCTLPRAGPVSLKLYDVSGKLVRTLIDGLRPAGPSAFSLEPSTLSGLAHGAYLLRLETRGPGLETIVVKLLVPSR